MNYKFFTIAFLFYSNISFAQINLPVDFEQSGVTYFTDFGGNESFVVPDPTNASNMVAISTKTATAETWAGTSIGTTLSSPIPFTASATTISLKVYSEYPGTAIHLKAEVANDPGLFVETRMYTTKANEWETIVFDFSNDIFESAALNLNLNYDVLSVFFNFGTAGATAGAKDFYWDDVEMGGVSTTLDQIDLPVTFELPMTSYALVGFENSSSVLGEDPTNSAETVAITTKPLNASPWAGTVIGTRNGFVNNIPFTSTATRVSMRVYSPAANTPILLKAEVASNPTLYVEVLRFTTTANEWETIEWDFLQNQPNTPSINFSLDYNLLAVFFNFGIDGATAGEQTYYWDDVTFGIDTDVEELSNIPVTSFPNPVKDKLQINIDGEITELRIFNALGQLVFAETVSSNKNVFDLSRLPTATYFVKVQTEEGSGAFTLLKE